MKATTKSLKSETSKLHTVLLHTIQQGALLGQYIQGTNALCDLEERARLEKWIESSLYE